MKKLQVYLATLIVVLLQCFIAPGAGATEPAPNEAVFYEHKGFVGKSTSVKLQQGLYYWGTPLGDNWIKRVSSVRLGSDIGVQLFQGIDFSFRRYEHGDTIECYGYIITESQEELGKSTTYSGPENHGCDNFFSAVVIFRKDIFQISGDPMFVGASISNILNINNNWSEYRRELLLYPPLYNSHCFDVGPIGSTQYGIENIIINKPDDPSHKVRATLYNRRSCTGNVYVTIPGPGSNKESFNVTELGFSVRRAPWIPNTVRSIRVTYADGPYLRPPKDKDKNLEITPQASGGSMAGSGVLLSPGSMPGVAGGWADAIKDFRLVSSEDTRLTFEVHYSVEPSHGNTVYLGGWIYDDKGQAISGYKPIAVRVPGPGKGRIEVTIDTGQKNRGKEIEFFLYEPNKGPFIKKRFTLNRRLPAAATQPPKVEMSTGYAVAPGVKALDGQQVDLSGTWNSNIGLVYQISQSGNKFSYQDPMMHKLVNGTVVGKTITVSWTEGNVVKSLKGSITSVDGDSKAKSINWANGVIFNRLSTTSTQPPKIKAASGYVVALGPKAQEGQQIDIAGKWTSNIGLIYQISQNGNNFSYQDPMMHKPVNGTVDGKTVTVSWMEGNAAKNLKGTVTEVGNNGKAKRIEWKNSVVFHR